MLLMTPLVSVPAPHQSSLAIPRWNQSMRTSSKLVVTHASSSSSTDELSDSAQTNVRPLDSERPFPPGSCQACGKPEKERGFNGEGRIRGGIATVPGFGCWQIKAYRPCPAFVEIGGRYKRFGQSLDDVVSGRGRPRAVVLKSEDDSRYQLFLGQKTIGNTQNITFLPR